MKASRIRLFLVVGLLAVPTVCLAQQAVTRDPQAALLVAKAVMAMGGTVPSNSLATGTVELVEGSLQESGTVRILTRGLDQTREEFQTSRGLRGGFRSPKVLLRRFR